MILRLALPLVFVAGPAAAHGTLPGGTGFLAGALHPLVATDHLVALLAVGLALGRIEARPGHLALGLLALLAGLSLGLSGLALPASLILLVALALGGLLLSGRDLPLGLVAPPILLLGGAIGAHSDLPAGPNLASRAGVAVAAALIVLNLAAMAQWAAPRWPIFSRIAGSWMVAIAMMVLALRIAGP